MNGNDGAGAAGVIGAVAAAGADAAAGAADDAALRAAIADGCRELVRRGLTHGTSGNISVRRNQREFFLSPTGMAYDSLQADDIPMMDLDGRWFGRRRPSSEWRFHRDIFRHRDDVNAIVHTHSPNATALACTARGIPAFHYMVAVAGGVDVRCAPYRTFGTEDLSKVALLALEDRRACLLANHGVIACGRNLPAALALAGEIENLASQYGAALALGDVRLLDDGEMRRVLDKFRDYGSQDAADEGLEYGGGT
jgi:L-fuculose-phosphate aldolase